MATLVDLTKQMVAFGNAIGATRSHADKLVRTTGELTQIQFQPPTLGRLTLEQPVYRPPTIDASRAFDTQQGFIPGVGISRTFLNYASTFLGFGNTGYYTTDSRASGG